MGINSAVEEFTVFYVVVFFPHKVKIEVFEIKKKSGTLFVCRKRHLEFKRHPDEVLRDMV